MATGRTLNRWARTYIGGYDMSGYTRNIGPLTWSYPTPDLTVQSDAVRGGLPDTPEISPGTLNGVMDGDAAGLFATYGAGGTGRILTAAFGIRTAPAQGDPVFCGRFGQLDYQGAEAGGAMYTTVPFGMADMATLQSYDKPWGTLLHANSAATAVNSATGVDDFGAATTYGGYMVYHVLAGNGTATIKVQHASTNSDGSFADLGGCTTGVTDFSSVASGIVNTTAKTTTVNRYLRWQIVLGTATTVTFVLSFIRETRARA